MSAGMASRTRSNRNLKSEYNLTLKGNHEVTGDWRFLPLKGE